MSNEKLKIKAFTLVELLVVIAIISLLSSIVLASLETAREKAARAKTLEELVSIRNAIAFLESDTGKWPGGCPSYVGNNPEINLNIQKAGLRTQIEFTNDPDTTCNWTNDDVLKWNGPYVQFDLVDLWGNSYIFDPDYVPYANASINNIADPNDDYYNWNCPNSPPMSGSLVGNVQWNSLPSDWGGPAIVSYGPNKSTTKFYGCDEIFLMLLGQPIK